MTKIPQVTVEVTVKLQVNHDHFEANADCSMSWIGDVATYEKQVDAVGLVEEEAEAAAMGLESLGDESVERPHLAKMAGADERWWVEHCVDHEARTVPKAYSESQSRKRAVMMSCSEDPRSEEERVDVVQQQLLLQQRLMMHSSQMMVERSQSKVES